VAGVMVTLPNGGEWQAALLEHRAAINAIQARRYPKIRASNADSLIVVDLLNEFRTAKKDACSSKSSNAYLTECVCSKAGRAHTSEQ
jgi:hypothetical protein